jgi:hypothetical protein
LDTHQVSTAYELGWSLLRNGELIEQAESRGFEVLITTDQNLRYQQNLSDRAIAILVLSTTSWPRIKRTGSIIAEALSQISAGDYLELAIPDETAL